MKRFRPNIGIHQNLYGDNLDDGCMPITTDDSRPYSTLSGRPTQQFWYSLFTLTCGWFRGLAKSKKFQTSKKILRPIRPLPIFFWMFGIFLTLQHPLMLTWHLFFPYDKTYSIKNVLSYTFLFVFIIMKDLVSINQVDNRTGWLDSVTLQLGPTSHAQLICHNQH